MLPLASPLAAHMRWFERELGLRAACRGDVVVVGVFEVGHGEDGHLPDSHPAKIGSDLEGRLERADLVPGF